MGRYLEMCRCASHGGVISVFGNKIARGVYVQQHIFKLRLTNNGPLPDIVKQVPPLKSRYYYLVPHGSFCTSPPLCINQTKFTKLSPVLTLKEAV